SALTAHHLHHSRHAKHHVAVAHATRHRHHLGHRLRRAIGLHEVPHRLLVLFGHARALHHVRASLDGICPVAARQRRCVISGGPCRSTKREQQGQRKEPNRALHRIPLLRKVGCPSQTSPS